MTTHRIKNPNGAITEIVLLADEEKKPYEHAIVKFNGGSGALLCNKCHTILKHGLDHEDKEYYCNKCKVDWGVAKR